MGRSEGENSRFMRWKRGEISLLCFAFSQVQLSSAQPRLFEFMSPVFSRRNGGKRKELAPLDIPQKGEREGEEDICSPGKEYLQTLLSIFHKTNFFYKETETLVSSFNCTKEVQTLLHAAFRHGGWRKRRPLLGKTFRFPNGLRQKKRKRRKLEKVSIGENWVGRERR